MKVPHAGQRHFGCGVQLCLCGICTSKLTNRQRASTPRDCRVRHCLCCLPSFWCLPRGLGHRVSFLCCCCSLCPGKASSLPSSSSSSCSPLLVQPIALCPLGLSCVYLSRFVEGTMDLESKFRLGVRSGLMLHLGQPPLSSGVILGKMLITVCRTM